MIFRHSQSVPGPGHRFTCQLLVGLALVIAASGAISPGADAEGGGGPLPPVTLEDVLKIEGFGDARFSPDGRWLAFNQIPPYDELRDYSFGLYGYIQSGHQIHILDLSRDAAPELHPGFDPDASSYLLGFSPDSRYVVALVYKLGHFGLIACQVETDDCRHFDVMPDIRDSYFGSAPWNERLVWTSDTRFVLPVRDAFQPGSELRSRAVAGRFLAEQWQRAWTGTGVTATEVLSTGPDRAADWADGQLLEFDLDQGAIRQLASGRFAGARLSPDGSQLAAARVSERIRPLPEPASDPDVTHSPFDRRYQLTLIDRSGLARPVSAPFSVDPNSIEWSADGRDLVVYGWDRAGEPAEGRLYRIDAGDLTASTIPAPGLKLANNRLDEGLPLTIGPARLLPFRDGVGVFARPEDGGRYDWYLLSPGRSPRLMTGPLRDVSGFPLFASANRALIQSGDGVYRIGPDITPEKIAAGRQGDISSLAYRPNPAHSWSYAFRFGSDLHRDDWGSAIPLLLSEEKGGADTGVMFLKVHEEDQTEAELPVPVAGARVLAASAEAGAVLVTAKDGAATRMVLIRRSGTEQEIAQINTHLNSVSFPLTTTIRYQLRDPERPEQVLTVTGCLTLPADYSAERRYPLVVEVYPVGQPGSCGTLRDGAKPALSLRDIWASLGFIHVRPGMPLDLARTEEGPLGGSGEVLEQVADYLVAQGYADPDRIALYGFSQGGVSALQAATQTDRFAAVISMNGWADYFSHYFGPRGLMRYFHLDQNGGDNRWRYDCLEEGADHSCPFGFGKSPLEAPAEYAESSPVALARNISAPVMLIHSDLDYFDMSQYDEMFGALYRAGKDAVYVRYWGEGHGPSSPANMRDVWMRIRGFLETAGVAGKGPDPETQSITGGSAGMPDTPSTG